MKNKKVLIFVALAVAVFGITFLVISMTGNPESEGEPKSSMKPSEVSENAALELMGTLYNDIRVNTLKPVKENVDLDAVDVKESLPEISKYPAQVESTTADFIEIFSSTEKATVATSGSDTDRWLVDMADSFNKSGAMVGGRPISVRVRGIASGLGMDYISSGKYVPDAFSPSNELWGDALQAGGVKVTLSEKRLAGNVAGFVLNKQKYDELMGKYGTISIKTITDAVAANEIIMGYTNPFASSTGVNFLMSALYSFDKENPLSETAVAAFEKFQTNIPFVAYTTLQMKEAAKSGSLEGFVFEYQQFMNSPDLRNDYVFVPFGVRHDNPVYELGTLSATKKEILKQFIAYCKTDANQKLATQYGFDGHDDYALEYTVSGKELNQAQKLWKEKKSGNREIISVFVADTSGSMAGEPMKRLKESLLSGSKYIGNDCSVGLVTFSDDVNVALPIGKFDLNQKSYFTGAVKNMTASGGTAMFDAIVVAEKMLMDQRAEHPEAKLMMFVLTDGETNVGSTLNDTRPIIEGLRVPVYTIGYNADIKALTAVSQINEAASINADIDDVVYKIQSLFNAQM